MWKLPATQSAKSQCVPNINSARHAAARFGLRVAELVLHFSDEMLAGDCQTIADQGALIDLGIDDCGHVKLTRLAPLEQHVLGPDHSFTRCPVKSPSRGGAGTRVPSPSDNSTDLALLASTVPSSRFDLPMKVVTNKSPGVS